MESLYSSEIKNLFHEGRWPKGLAAQIEEMDGYLQLIFFRDNFNSFTGDDQFHIANVTREFMMKVRGMGVPIYLEVRTGDGRIA